MIDLHCHILPGVDDGPRNEAESLRMAEMALKDGIRTVVATPHSHNGLYTNDQIDIARNCARLNALVQSLEIPLEILPGAEVRIHAGMDLSLREGRIASLNGGQRYLLVEFPYNLVPPGTREVLFQLLANDITPVLAHPERNEAIQRNPEVLADLVDRGCLAQLTAMSVTGELGHAAMACAHLLLQRRLVHVMATDAHDVTGRPPILSRAVDAVSHLLGDGDAAASLVMNTPRAILNGKPVRLASKGSTTAKRGWWQRWGDSIGSGSRRRM